MDTLDSTPKLKSLREHLWAQSGVSQYSVSEDRQEEEEERGGAEQRWAEADGSLRITERP